MESAPKDGRLVRLKGEWGFKNGRYGQYGSIFGWMEIQNRTKGYIYPEPEMWAELGYKDPPVDPADIEPPAPKPKRTNVFDIEKWSAVYVIGCAEVPYVKIGYSFDPALRLEAMQVGCPYTMRIYGALFGPEDDAAVVESYVHRQLKEDGRHFRGEWFGIEPSEAMQLIKVMSEKNDRLLLRPGDMVNQMYSERFECGAHVDATFNMHHRLRRLMKALAEAA